MRWRTGQRFEPGYERPDLEEIRIYRKPVDREAAPPEQSEPAPLGWIDFPEGMRQIGHEGEGFAFDNTERESKASGGVSPPGRHIVAARPDVTPFPFRSELVARWAKTFS